MPTRPPTSHRPVLAAALAIACAGLLSTSAPASAQQQLGAPEIDRLVALLDSDEFSERQRASDTLRGATGLDHKSLLERMDDPAISAEQRLRLLEIAKQRYVEEPRAGLGVRIVQQSEPVAIQVVYDEFPAGKQDLLRAGDQFLEIGGVDLEGMNSLQAWGMIRAVIMSYKPGEKMPMTIARPLAGPAPAQAKNAGDIGARTRRLELTVPLGSLSSFEEQNAVAQPNAALLERSWDLRLKRMGLGPGRRTLDARAQEPTIPPMGDRRLVTQGQMIPAPLNVSGDFAGVNHVHVQRNANGAIQRVIMPDNRRPGVVQQIRIGDGGNEVLLRRVEQQRRAQLVQQLQRQRLAGADVQQIREWMQTGEETPDPTTEAETASANRLALRIASLSEQITRARSAVGEAETPALRQAAEDRLRELGDELDQANIALRLALGFDQAVAEAASTGEDEREELEPPPGIPPRRLP